LISLAKEIPEGSIGLLNSEELDPWIEKLTNKESGEEVKELDDMLKKRKEEILEDEKRKKRREWTEEDINNLSKALKKFPEAIPNRWAQITEFVKTHTQKEVVAKAQELIRKEELEELEKKMSKVAFEEYKKKLGIITIDQSKVWTSEEQKALELALKKYPSSLPANERWKKIAEDLPTKTKTAKDCLERVKEVHSINNIIDQATIREA